MHCQQPRMNCHEHFQFQSDAQDHRDALGARPNDVGRVGPLADVRQDEERAEVGPLRRNSRRPSDESRMNLGLSEGGAFFIVCLLA